jgi:hypothetical protein
MTQRPLLPPPPTPVARATLGPNAHTGTGSPAPAARPGEVHWGQANGCIFRFDPQATPRRTGAALVPTSSRRVLPLPPRKAAAARAAGSSGRAGRVAMALGDAADFDADDDVNDADDTSIAAAGSAEGAGSQGGGEQGGQGERAGQGASGGGDGNSNGDSNGDNNGSDWATDLTEPSASAGAWFQPESAAGPAASAFDGDRSVSPMWLVLTSAASSLPLRQRALAAMGAAEPTLRCGEALGHVRAALIEAVNSGAFVPKVDPASPDQNCLLPLLLLRAWRPMPSALRAQAGARAAAMLSMAERVRRAPQHPLQPVTAP